MRPLTLLIPALLGLGGTPTLASVEATTSVVAPVGDYTELVAEYDAAVEAWKASIKAAEDSKVRKELRAQNPAIAFWPRFEALGRGGEGQALMWMVDHVRDKGVKSKERGGVLTPLYEELVESHVNNPWFGETVKQLARDAKYVGDDATINLLTRIAGTAKNKDIAAQSLYMAATKLGESDVEGAQERSRALLAEITEKYGDTDWATLLKARTIKPEQVAEGAMAPDFAASTIDGFKFKLSDYKGKVVLLDFYGFW